ncbi:SubName: Full=Related to TAF10-TFIID and SAGA subunit {ECO:0000313/EMBL:CCA75053.1} [Serendipita indica DSM 11827]|nr:SubName: Full=Related to TAF10-TFIID and SAGA subunit {ECO:0000313/EMBL:CCA75053.1} [Serendipita indica DSM 11827]
MSTMTFQSMPIPSTSAAGGSTLSTADGTDNDITPSSSLNTRSGAAKYRGASVEDLQLGPAFALSKNQNVMQAIELAYDRDFSYLPILDRNRRPLGYINVPALKQAWEAGQIDADAPVQNVATKFDRSSKTGRPYSIITPDTPLEELEEFLRTNDFALVTDHGRKFVLGVATKQDLDNFVTRRGNAF